jgi:hypothetical protein
VPRLPPGIKESLSKICIDFPERNENHTQVFPSFPEDLLFSIRRIKSLAGVSQISAEP